MSKLYTLKLTGNHKDPKGNPLGYHRQTQRSKWTAKSKDYHDWQQWVQWKWIQQNEALPETIRWAVSGGPQWGDKDSLTVFGKKPPDHYEFNCRIVFKGERHSDYDNCRKGIQDSLWKSDRHVWGTVKGDHGSDPQVLIEVFI